MENSNVPKKKMAAIMAAVAAYIQTEEEPKGYAKIIKPSGLDNLSPGTRDEEKSTNAA